MDDIAFSYLVNQEINMFNGKMDNNISQTVKISTVLSDIQSGRWKDEIEWLARETDDDERAYIKGKFPAVTFSGTFHTKRAAINILKYSHVMVVDVDKFTMPFEKTLECLKSCHFIFAAFRSPSGGIKALAYSKMKVEAHKEVFFIGVEEYLRDNFGIKMDPSGKDISRLCFISYDPELYLSPEGKRPFNLQEDAPKTYWEVTNNFQQVITTDYKEYEASHDMDWIMEWAVKWAVEKTGGFVQGSRNNYLFYLSCILNRAGVRKELTLDVLNNRYPSIRKEISGVVNSAYKYNKHEHGTRPIFKRKSSQTTITDL